MPWRCPNCNAAIKVDADWCGQCYADLRPPPPPPPVVPPRPPAYQPHADAIAAAGAAGATGLDATPGAAPYDAAGTPAGPMWTEAADRPRAGWPCTECGALNDFELTACAACGMPFGAALREPRPALPGDRRTRLFVAAAVALVLMALVALLSSGGATPEGDDAVPPVVEQQDVGGG